MTFALQPARAIPLGSVLQIRTEIVHPKDMPAGGATFVGLEHIERDTGVRISSEQIDLASMTGRRSRFHAGDILYGYLRPYLNKVWVAEFDGLCSVDQYVLVVRPGVSRSYVAHFLRSPSFLQTAPIDTAPGQLPRLRSAELTGTLIPLPALDEQRRIAALLDKADALRRKRKRAIALLDNLTQSIFQKLFGIEGAPVSIRPKGGISGSGSWALLTDVARLATGHTPDRKKPEYWSGDIPWISLGDIRNLHGREAQYTRENVTALGIANSSSVLLPQGTVCFSRTASVGFSTIMSRPMATSQDFVNWVCGDGLLPEYLLGALVASQQELRALATGSTHRTIYFPTVERFQVFVPSLAEQKAYVDQRKAYMRTRYQMETNIEPLESLFAVIQHRAFSGQI